MKVAVNYFEEIYSMLDSGLASHPSYRVYLEETRNIKPEVFFNYGGRTTPGFEYASRALIDKFIKRGIPRDFLLKYNFISGGNDSISRSLVFPLTDADGQIVKLNGRNVNKKKTHWVRGRGPALYNGKLLKQHKTLFLTENPLEALSLISVGIKNVVAAHGVGSASWSNFKTTCLFKTSKVKKVYILFDNDKAGVEASHLVGARLQKLGIKTTILTFDDSWYVDLNMALQETKTPEKFREFLSKKIKILPLNIDLVQDKVKRDKVAREEREEQKLKSREVQNKIDVIKEINIKNFIKKYYISGRGYKSTRSSYYVCPVHSDTEPSFHIYDRNSDGWHCFGACAAGGDLIDFVCLAEELSFKDAIEFILDKEGLN